VGLYLAAVSPSCSRDQPATKRELKNQRVVAIPDSLSNSSSFEVLLFDERKDLSGAACTTLLAPPFDVHDDRNRCGYLFDHGIEQEPLPIRGHDVVVQ
jgi:hypothetical protein